jgi:putative glutamine amidotransferase
VKVVCVSQRIDHYPDRYETRDELDQRLITWLLLAGLLPVPLPNGLCRPLPDGQCDHEALDAFLASLRPGAFVLSGGNDIGQYIIRDLTESRLLNYAKKHHKPVLGICRGMQMIAHWAGTSLQPVRGHLKTRHYLSGVISCEVNSYHAFSLTACPEDFDVLAQSEDGEIEAIRHRSLPWEGWMWHPEREAQFSTSDIRRLKALFA